MPAVELLHGRVTFGEDAFAELVLWQLDKRVRGSRHRYKYRLAYVVAGEPVIRYDNEAGKGDHRHYDAAEETYSFSTPERLVVDFQRDITRWNHENGHS